MKSGNWLWCLVSMVLLGGTAMAGPSKPTKAKRVSPYQTYIKRIKKQLKRKPNNVRLLTILGRLHQKSGSMVQAEQAYRKALRIKPHFSHALVGLAHVALYDKKLKQAETLLKRVLKRHPKHARAWAEHSELWRLRAAAIRTPRAQQRALKRSIDSLKRAIIARPKTPQYRYRLGILYIAMRQYMLAHVQFTAAHTQRSFHPCYRLGLGITEAMIMRGKAKLYNELHSGMRLCGHPFLRKMGGPLLVATTIQRIQQQPPTQKKGQAIKQIKAMLRLVPESSKGHFFLALLYYQNNQCEASRRVLKQLLKRQPNHVGAKKLLKHSKALRCGPLPSGRFSRKTNNIRRIRPRRVAPKK